MSPLIVLTGTVYTLLLPNLYESASRITVQGDAECEAPCEHCAYISPVFIQAEMIVLESKPVLYEVMKRLELQQVWGTGGEKLPRSVAFKILSNSLRISQMRDTAVIEISVRRDNPDEVAMIANEMAVVYRDYREQVQRTVAKKELDRLEAAMKVQMKNVEQAEEALQKIRTTLDIGVNGKSNDLTDEETRSFREAIKTLEADLFEYNRLKACHQSAGIDQEAPASGVQLIDIAEPNRRPVSPNLFLNVLLSVAQAGMMGLVGLFLIMSGRRKQA